MLLSLDQFDKSYESQTLRIALIGMSNIGKSHWTQQIVENHNFIAYEVDTAIQKQLSLNSMDQSADWMGHPFEKGYQQKALQYLELESQLSMKANEINGNVILDTTGSFIHIDNDTQTKLTAKYLTVYLRANTHAINLLIKRFKRSPKPLIWGDHFEKHPYLSNIDSMFLCYPELLKARESLYDTIADITLDVTDLKSIHETDFIQALREAL